MDWSADDAAFGCPFGFTLLDEIPTLRSKSVTALVAVKAIIVPFAADCGNHNIIEYRLLAPGAIRCSSAGVAVETPSVAILFNKGSVGVEGL